MDSAEEGTGGVNVVFDMVINLRHLDLVVNQVCSKVPVCHHLLHTLGQLIKLTQRVLTEIVKVELQGHQTVVGLE